MFLVSGMGWTHLLDTSVSSGCHSSFAVWGAWAIKGEMFWAVEPAVEKDGRIAAGKGVWWIHFAWNVKSLQSGIDARIFDDPGRDKRLKLTRSRVNRFMLCCCQSASSNSMDNRDVMGSEFLCVWVVQLDARHRTLALNAGRSWRRRANLAEKEENWDRLDDSRSRLAGGQHRCTDYGLVCLGTDVKYWETGFFE